MKNLTLTRQLGVLISVFSISAVPVNAQILEEIVVTAEKREEKLSDVSISVTAFTGEQLKRLGYKTTRELNGQIPNLTITDFGGVPQTVLVTIRGLTQDDFLNHQESPNSVFYDNAYNSFLGGIGNQLFDIDRVEVLRGPQGTLFGRNATGGLIHILTAKPTDEFEGYGEITAGSYEMVRFEGAISGPLSDELSGRLSIATEHNGGFVENRADTLSDGTVASDGKDGGNMENYSLRSRLLWSPGDDTEVLITGRYSRDDDVRAAVYDINAALNLGAFDPSIGGPNVNLPNVGSYPLSQSDFNSYCLNVFAVSAADSEDNCTGNDDDDDFAGSFSDSFFNRESYGITLDINHSTGDIQITSITDFKTIEQDYREDSDGVSRTGPALEAARQASIDGTLFGVPTLPPGAPIETVIVADFIGSADTDQFSQELRISGENASLQWQTGAYLLYIDGDYTSGYASLETFGAANENFYSLETLSYAFFVEAQYFLTQEVTFIGGVRWTRDEKEFSFIGTCTNNTTGTYTFDFFGLADPCVDFGFVVPGAGFIQDIGFTKETAGDLTELNDDAFSFKAQIEWQPNDDLLFYGGVTRANKAGNFNAGIANNIVPAVVPFQQEILTSYEAGVKTTLLNGTVRLSAAGFYYDYEDYQAATFTPDFVNLISNVEADVVGGEVEIYAQPFENTTFVFGASYLDAEADGVPIPFGSGELVPLKQDMPQAPKWSANGLLRQDWPTTFGNLFTQIDFNYVDERATSTANSPIATLESYVLANLRVGMSTADDKWTATFFINNLTDTTAIQKAFDLSLFGGYRQLVNGTPRWYGGTIRYQF